MAEEDLRDYLVAFLRLARSSGLDVREPGKNWVRVSDIARGSHVSLSVRRDRIQVNLNNEQDEDRRRFRRLYAERLALETVIGSELDWEAKEGRKKTAVRVTLNEGYETGDRNRQHRWALEHMQAFQREFGKLLGGGLE